MALESSTTNDSCKAEKTVFLIWGCELNSEKPTYTFVIPDDWSHEQQLALRTVCLGHDAKDEFNIVEIIPTKGSQESAPVCIATLKRSVLPMAAFVGFDLTPPVTFRLRVGSGPVYLAGQHATVVLNWDEEEEESSQEEEEMEGSFKEESPVKRPTRAGSKLATTAKKEKEEVAGAEPSLGKGASKGKKLTAKK